MRAGLASGPPVHEDRWCRCGFDARSGTIAIVRAPAFAAAAPASAPVRSCAGQQGDGIADFYRARAGRPLWLAPQAGDAPQTCCGLLSSAAVDGLDPERYQVDRIASALARRAERRPSRGQRCRAAAQPSLRRLRPRPAARPEDRHRLCRPRADPGPAVGRAICSSAPRPRRRSKPSSATWRG